VAEFTWRKWRRQELFCSCCRG